MQENRAFRYQQNTSSFQYYWNQGIGAELLKKLPSKPVLTQADLLYPYLFQGDAASDQLIEELFDKLGFAQAQNLVKQYIYDPTAVPAAYQGCLANYFQQLQRKPSWLDTTLLKQGLELSQRSGISGLIVLRDYCLMGGYESAAINKPLIYTGALKKGAAKRLTETVEFWVNITATDAFAPQGAGFENIIHTRLIHAYSRVRILQHSDWETHKWGLPLNTWDMLATNLGFSLVFLVGLRQMGIQANEQEIKGLFHLWKYIGYTLGIPLELLPDTEEQAIHALYLWTMTQADGDADSKLLAKALQEEPIAAYYPKHALGRKLMREIHLYYNHFLLGAYSCDILQLDKTRIGKIAHLNILKNRFSAKKMNQAEYREQAILQGRHKHEEVRAIYQTFNAR